MLTSATMCAFQSSSEPKTTNFWSRQDFSVQGKCAWLRWRREEGDKVSCDTLVDPCD